MSSAVWVLIPALFFGFALAKTGLGRRIAYRVLKTFEPSYLGIVVSWFIIGLILSALTPSITVRLSVMMPIAISVVEACKLAERSRGSALICLVAWGTAVLPGTGWLTGSLWGIFMMGFYPAEMKPLVTFDSWFAYMAVPWFLVTIMFVALLYVIMKPKEPLAISRDVFREQYVRVGKNHESGDYHRDHPHRCSYTFATEKLHHLPTAAVALLALVALMIFKILTLPEIDRCQLGHNQFLWRGGRSDSHFRKSRHLRRARPLD